MISKQVRRNLAASALVFGGTIALSPCFCSKPSRHIVKKPKPRPHREATCQGCRPRAARHPPGREEFSGGPSPRHSRFLIMELTNHPRHAASESLTGSIRIIKLLSYYTMFGVVCFPVQKSPYPRFHFLWFQLLAVN